MKSREKIVIIMLQWLRLYTLGSRGSRELKTFLETRLTSSRVDQKLKSNEELHGFLKGKLAQKSLAIELVVGADSWRRGSGFLGRFRGFKFATNPLQFCFQKAQRSGHDHLQFRFKKDARSLKFRFKKEATFLGVMGRASWP